MFKQFQVVVVQVGHTVGQVQGWEAASEGQSFKNESIKNQKLICSRKFHRIKFS